MMERLRLASSSRRHWIVFLACTTLLSACALAKTRVSGSDSEQSIAVETPTDAVIEGGLFLISVQAPKAIKDPAGMFQGHSIDFYPDSEHDASGGFKRYSALVGVEYGTAPGSIDVDLTFKIGDELVRRKASVSVKSGVFPSERLRVPPKTVFPSAKERKLIVRDRRVLARAYATKTTTRYWDPPLVMPTAKGEITSVFGSSRVYNGKKHNVHFGTDLRAPTGTPIITPITGMVAVARHLFYTGNTVILDHGFGFFTIYGHLSKLEVKEGEVAKKGQVMGLSGMTGRASGPHLHWGVNLHGIKIDPMTLSQVLAVSSKPM